MVAEIGIIIGFYVIMRTIDVMSRPREKTNTILFAAALFTLLVTGLMTASLAIRGFSIGQ